MDLPSGWRRETIADLARGGLFSDGDWVESKDQDPSGSVRLTQLADVGVGAFRDRSRRWLREDQASSLGCTFLEADDVLIARMPDPIGRACQVPPGVGRAVTAVDVAVLRPARPDIDPRYVMWAINSPEVHGQIAALQSGTTRKRVSRKNLSTVWVPVPTLSEQQRIVEILEDHLSRLEAADRYVSAARIRARTLEDRSVLSRLLPGRTLSAVTEVASDALTPLPGEWSWRRLSDVAVIVGGVTKDAKKQSDAGAVEVPYLRVANVQRAHLDLRDVATIRVRPSQAEALRLEPGDVLMNEGGDRDKLARGWVWSGQITGCIHQNHVFRARPAADLVRPEWLAWCANTYGAHWAQRHGRQSVNLASISLSTLSRMPIPVAPLAEQDNALAAIRETQGYIRSLDSTLDLARRNSDTLRRALMAAAFSGRLTGTSADLEIAEEMALA